jgi:hypothetical protein
MCTGKYYLVDVIKEDEVRVICTSCSSEKDE